jgi:hypothetical protein
MLAWLKQHKFEAHLAAFLLMVLTSIGLYTASSAGLTFLIWVLLGGFALANGLAMVLK